MRFDLPGTDAFTRPYWDAAAEGRLLIRCCAACGRAHRYPREFCPYCWSEDVGWEEVSGAATLYTWSVVHRNDLRSADVARSEAETLAAIASGIQSLARTVSTKFGDGTGSVEHSLVAVGGSLLMTVEAGGAHLAVLAEEDADPGIIGNSMSALADGLDAYITSPQRAPGEGGDSSA